MTPGDLVRPVGRPLPPDVEWIDQAGRPIPWATVVDYDVDRDAVLISAPFFVAPLTASMVVWRGKILESAINGSLRAVNREALELVDLVTEVGAIHLDDR